MLEKETRIRETMLMMGLSQWVLWSTWYIKQVLFLLGPAIIITLCLRVSHVMNGGLLIVERVLDRGARTLSCIWVMYMYFSCISITGGWIYTYQQRCCEMLCRILKFFL